MQRTWGRGTRTYAEGSSSLAAPVVEEDPPPPPPPSKVVCSRLNPRSAALRHHDCKFCVRLSTHRDQPPNPPEVRVVL